MEEETQEWADVVASDSGKVGVPMSPHMLPPLPPQKRPERERLFALRVGWASEISKTVLRDSLELKGAPDVAATEVVAKLQNRYCP